MNKPAYDYHFVLCEDGTIFDLLDVLIFDDSIEKTVEKITQEHGKITKTALNPIKLFDEVVGYAKDGRILPIGATNWEKLFMIRDQFEWYYAYIHVNGERILVANSKEGLSWTFNVINA